MDLLINKRDKLYNTRRYNAVIECCNEILSHELTEEIKDRTLFIKGVSYYVCKKYDIAIGSLKMCRCVASKFYSALSYDHLYQFDKAMMLYEEIIRDNTIDKDNDYYLMSRRNIINMLLERNKMTEIYRLFPEYIGDINIQDSSGETLLHHSVIRKFDRSIRQLLVLGACPFISGKFGTNVFHIAIKNNEWYVIGHIISLLCDETTLQTYNDTPKKFKFQRLLQILQDKKQELISLSSDSEYEECINLLNDKMETDRCCAICEAPDYMSIKSRVCLNCHDKITLNKSKFKPLNGCFLCDNGKDLLICRHCSNICDSL